MVFYQTVSSSVKVLGFSSRAKAVSRQFKTSFAFSEIFGPTFCLSWKPVQILVRYLNELFCTSSMLLLYGLFQAAWRKITGTVATKIPNRRSCFCVSVVSREYGFHHHCSYRICKRNDEGRKGGENRRGVKD